MVEAQVIIVGDARRETQIIKLTNTLRGSHLILDSWKRGALWNHIRALELAGGLAHHLGKRCIIMEDDAIPVVDFLPRAQAWFDRFPDDLISFYLGTGRPARHQWLIDDRMKEADAAGRDWLSYGHFLHGVCYSIPPAEIPRVLENLRRTSQREADYAIGAAWGRPVIYAVESLVEHRDGPVVERHPDGQPRVERRVARRLAGPLMYPGDEP